MVSTKYLPYWELCRKYREGKISETTFHILLDDLVAETPSLRRFKHVA